MLLGINVKTTGRVQLLRCTNLELWNTLSTVKQIARSRKVFVALDATGFVLWRVSQCLCASHS